MATVLLKKVIYHGIEIIYSRRSRKADDVIKKLIDNKREKEILVVTSDREAAHYAICRNAAAVPSQEFEQTVFRILSAEQMSVRSLPTHEEENEEDDNHYQRRDKKKGPSHKFSRRKCRFHNSIKNYDFFPCQ